MSAPAKIMVVGSANLDYLVRVGQPPAPGETVLASGLLLQPGGKGANQAVAAARLGAQVRFLGAVGDDHDGQQLVQALQRSGVDTSAVEVITGVPSGRALVSVYDSGENSIIVIPGSNFALKAERVRRAVQEFIASADPTVVVVQAEVPPEALASAIQSSPSARVILNLAPFQPLAAKLLAPCDPVVVNEAEASGLLEREVAGREAALQAVSELAKRARSAVITIGAAGACWADASGSGHIVAPRASAVVDTTGAGDAFVGALATSLAQTASLAEAVQLGVAAGTYSVSRPGAQTSYPTLADLR